MDIASQYFGTAKEKKEKLLCLYCNELEKSYTPTVDFVCSSCVQLFLGQSQELIKKAHAALINLGRERRAWALESFIRPEVIDGKRPKSKSKSVKRNFNRARIVRPVRR